MNLICINDFLLTVSNAVINNSASSSGPLSPSVKILLAAAILLVLVILIVAVAVILRKRFNNQEDVGEGFLLSDLRKMHKRGDLTDQELEATKALVIKKSQEAQQINNTPPSSSSSDKAPETNVDIEKNDDNNLDS